ncbi:MAG: hypothetical protein ACRCVJ_18715 [Clostridium sp.]|uniref:hypothetical protein n=1 Tax=Clostridium sp. TaxID=1506 RepID=UPI003F2F1E65
MLKLNDILELGEEKYIVAKEDDEYMCRKEGCNCITATGTYDTLMKLSDSMEKFIGHYILLNCRVGKEYNVQWIRKILK